MNTFFKNVKPTENRQIPDKYDLHHAICFFLTDQLSQLVVDLNLTGALSVHFDVPKEEEAQIKELEGDDLWRWLEKSGRDDVIYEMTYRQVSSAVIADASIFICESLLACAKGKTAVAYSLLRKPMKENLLLLEWLCGDPAGFIKCFNGEAGGKFSLDRLSIDRRKDIVKASVLTTKTRVADEDLLWLLRFGKEYPRSFETMWTKATHLVTSVKASETEAGNLNFIFSTESAILDQWEHYYSNLPLLLMYYLDVVECILSRYVKWNNKSWNLQQSLRTLAYMRFAQIISGNDSTDEKYDEILEYFSDVVLACEKCGTKSNMTNTDIDRLWLNSEVECAGCGEVVVVSGLPG